MTETDNVQRVGGVGWALQGKALSVFDSGSAYLGMCKTARLGVLCFCLSLVEWSGRQAAALVR